MKEVLSQRCKMENRIRKICSYINNNLESTGATFEVETESHYKEGKKEVREIHTMGCIGEWDSRHPKLIHLYNGRISTRREVTTKRFLRKNITDIYTPVKHDLCQNHPYYHIWYDSNIAIIDTKLKTIKVMKGKYYDVIKMWASKHKYKKIIKDWC
jgi:hypothetical protein